MNLEYQEAWIGRGALERPWAGLGAVLAGMLRRVFGRECRDASPSPRWKEKGEDAWLESSRPCIIILKNEATL
jgi:hypothetical protein